MTSAHCLGANVVGLCCISAPLLVTPLFGFSSVIFPYVPITDFAPLHLTQYIAGVTNPLFEDPSMLNTPHWSVWRESELRTYIAIGVGADDNTGDWQLEWSDTLVIIAKGKSKCVHPDDVKLSLADKLFCSDLLDKIKHGEASEQWYVVGGVAPCGGAASTVTRLYVNVQGSTTLHRVHYEISGSNSNTNPDTESHGSQDPINMATIACVERVFRLLATPLVVAVVHAAASFYLQYRIYPCI
jgi:hypothetical protein